MEVRHYIRDDTLGTGPYRFRHFRKEPSRFAQFVNGTLEEIREEDFEDATVFDTKCISFYTGGHIGVSLPFLKIYMPNTINVLLPANVPGMPSAAYFSFAPVQYIKFSTQLTDFSDNNICYLMGEDASYVADFSEHTIIPALKADSDVNFSGNAEIRVRSALLSSWTSAWAGHLASGATIVGV